MDLMGMISFQSTVSAYDTKMVLETLRFDHVAVAGAVRLPGPVVFLG